MAHLPSISSNEYEMYIELSEDRQQWRRAPSSPIPEETYLVEIETDQFFRIITKNKSTATLALKGWVEGKQIRKGLANGNLVSSGSSNTTDGFIRGNVFQEFKFTSTPVSEAAATAAEEALNNIGKIEMELTKVKRLQSVRESSLPVSTNDLNDSNAIWKESMKKRYGTNVGAGDTKIVSAVQNCYITTAISLRKKVVFICRDSLGCIAERKERGMPLPEVEAPLPTASSSSNNNNKKRTRESSDNKIQVIDVEASASSDQTPGKKMKLEKKSAAAASTNEMRSWNAEKVSVWIAELDPKFKALSYDKLFLENDVDGVALQCLNNEFLEQIGIKPVGHRAKILGIVSDYKQQGASSSASLSTTPGVIVIE